MRMPLDERAEGHHEIHTLVAVGVPNMSALAALQKDRAGSVYGGAARGRVHSFDERLLCPLEPLLGAGAAAGWDCLHDLRYQSAVPPPSTTRAAPVMKEESSDARKSTALAISSGVPILPMARVAQPARYSSHFSPRRRASAGSIGVSTSPGQMQFTRMPFPPSSIAIALVIRTIPPLDAQNAT